MGIVVSLAETLNVAWGFATDSAGGTLKDKAQERLFRREVVRLAAVELAETTGIDKKLFQKFLADEACLSFAENPYGEPPASKAYGALEDAVVATGLEVDAISRAFAASFEATAVKHADPIQALIYERVQALLNSASPDPVIPELGQINPPHRRGEWSSGKGHLVGRDNDLAELRGVLESSDNAAVTVHAIAGMGGIGKSALAAEYYHQYWRDYRFVWWVDASSPTTVAAGYGQLARFFSIPTDGPEADVRVEVDRRLESYEGWLAVFDDVQDRDAWDALRPSASTGTYLLTSRNRYRWEASIELGFIARDDAVEWLLEASTFSLDTDAEVVAAGEVADRLDGLALALSMATAYVAETRCSLVDYGSRPQHIVLDDRESLTGYKKTVYETWTASVEQLEAENQQVAIDILETICFYAPRKIPIWLFRHGEFGADPSSVDSAIRALTRLSLAESSGGFIDVHGLVQDVTRYHMGEPSVVIDATEPSTAANQ